ncbi:hypothetical protein ACS0TY_020846 [Phlomoides rotata]
MAGDHVIKLNISRASLKGFIAPEFYKLLYLLELNLASNGLTGKLPYQLGNLKYLEELRLNRNKLLGTIPASNTSEFSSTTHGMYASNGPMGFCASSQLKVVDLSYNFFVGSIPKCLEHLPRSSFQGNCLQDKDPKQRPAAQCSAAPPVKTRQLVHKLIENRPRHHSKESKPVWILVLTQTGLSC